MSHRRPNDTRDQPPATGQRKPYRRPEILSSEPMEIVAAVCTPPGKQDLASCPSGPINS